MSKMRRLKSCGTNGLECLLDILYTVCLSVRGRGTNYNRSEELNLEVFISGSYVCADVISSRLIGLIFSTTKQWTRDNASAKGLSAPEMWRTFLPK